MNYTRTTSQPPFPAVFGLFLATLFVVAMIRQSESTQFVLPDGVYISWQFIALIPFAIWRIPSMVLQLSSGFPVGLLLSGPVFFVYAITVDWFRAGDRESALIVDAAHVLVPALAAAALFGGRTVAQRHFMGKCLVTTLTVIALIYAIVAVLANAVDFGAFVTARPPGHENMNFIRLSGPLGVSTGLSLILLPSLAFCWRQAKLKEGYTWFWRLGIVLNSAFIVWTASRLSPLFLGAMILLAATARQIVVLLYLTAVAMVSINLPELILPEKWLRLGFSDSGRSMALNTTLAALTSGWGALAIGVGSNRLNILSQTVAEVARGELRFDHWSTEFGYFPYGPHSVLLWSLGSYGIVGALLRCAAFVAPWWHVGVRIVRQGLKSPGIPLTMSAVVISAIGFFFDDSHITHPYLVCVWYLFCFIGLDDLKRRGRTTVIQSPAPGTRCPQIRSADQPLGAAS